MVSSIYVVVCWNIVVLYWIMCDQMVVVASICLIVSTITADTQ